PRIMGVLNITPDSFSDGGIHLDPDIAIRAGLAMGKSGADIVDVGGESTRPGSRPTTPEQEQARVLPVVRALAAAGLRVSIDTRHAVTMAAALDAGATIVNDVTALTHDPAAAPLVAARGCPVILMHMRGDFATMYAQAVYTDVPRQVREELAARIAAAQAAGIRRAQIAIDPGIGFAKTAPQSAAMLRGLTTLHDLGCPILIGVSRKSFIGALADAPDAARRLPGSLAAALFAITQGAAILRVHDVPETIQALRIWQSLTTPTAPPQPA
ncbi:MAG TPA: dihydropteroate synthase, partial [Acetobacteraceae bacterium]|nr:dihydropteroate synthase [Acetobacteraceae bacterium]